MEHHQDYNYAQGQLDQLHSFFVRVWGNSYIFQCTLVTWCITVETVFSIYFKKKKKKSWMLCVVLFTSLILPKALLAMHFQRSWPLYHKKSQFPAVNFYCACSDVQVVRYLVLWPGFAIMWILTVLFLNTSLKCGCCVLDYKYNPCQLWGWDLFSALAQLFKKQAFIFLPVFINQYRFLIMCSRQTFKSMGI